MSRVRMLGVASLVGFAVSNGGCGSTCGKRCTIEPVAEDREAPRVLFQVGRDGQTWGTFVFELAPKEAPRTVANFLRYVDEGYYDGTIIHRVLVGEEQRIQIFQGGGYLRLGADARPGRHDPIPLETGRGLSNVRGTIAMARDAAPDTATSEYFVNLGDNTRLDFQSDEKPGYAVFGRIVEGWEVVTRIMQVQTEENPDPVLKGERSQPRHPPIVLRAHRLKR